MIIYTLRWPERHPEVALWIQTQADEAMYISAITVGEIRYGAERQRRTQPAFAELLERWLEYLEAWFYHRILPFDERAANRWGLLHAQLGYSNAGLQIAATAIHHGLTVVTRNVRDLAPTGASILNPFEEEDSTS